MNRKLTVAACILWLAGLAAFIIGLNVKTDTGRWLTVAGEITFLAGLALQGVLYYRNQKAAPEDPQKEPETKKPEDAASSDQSN